jgi:two-component system nitrogen regulation sensor histidine kinase NtrY
VKRLDFRKRLFLILSLFALVPAAVLTVAWGIAAWEAVPFVTAGTAWDRVAQTGKAAVEAVEGLPLTSKQQEALRTHELELEASVVQGRRLKFLAQRVAPVILLVAVGALAVLWIAASRVAGHLSRQLSRPIHELVGWTAMIEQGQDIPSTSATRGAPEFDVLRHRMRSMAAELEQGRQRAVEAERLVAFRETARRVAHELRNPLTPIQFALAQLKRSATPGMTDALKVLEEETSRLDRMAKSFAQFGKLPEGARSLIDIAELARSTATASVPSHLALQLELAPDLPLVEGHHDALQRALMNVVLNAVHACADSGAITVRAGRTMLDGETAVSLSVQDTGAGIPHHRLSTIWEPYVTHKAGGTGLGLAIARQAVLAHHGTVSAVSEPGEGTTIHFVLPTSSNSRNNEQP